jgi:hypothetical protein
MEEQNQKREKCQPCYLRTIIPQIWIIFEIKAVVGIETWYVMKIPSTCAIMKAGLPKQHEPKKNPPHYVTS